MTKDTIHARIIAAHGRHYLASAGNEMLHCVTRGKKSDVAVGDSVNILPTAKGQAVIESIQDRHSLLYRSDQYKSKLLAANVDQLFIVIATEPGFSDDLISRALVAAEAAGIKAHLILNKIDITGQLEKARQRAGFYASLGYPVHEVSATEFPDETISTLLPMIEGHSTILIGQSGMGKSTIVNLLVPGADIATREISTVLNSGKHTTTFTRMYLINDNTAVIDSPGFQEFGLYHLTEGMLERSFPEFKPYLGHCRFYNCHHLTEPGCAILEAVKEGHLSPMRHELYKQLVHESEQKVF